MYYVAVVVWVDFHRGGRAAFGLRNQSVSTVRTGRKFSRRGVQLQSLRQSSFGISQTASLSFKSFDEKPLPRTCC